jgi:hypothetical protein
MVVLCRGAELEAAFNEFQGVATGALTRADIELYFIE